MKKQVYIIGLLLILLIIKGCRKDPDSLQGNGNGLTTTPYNFVRQPWYPQLNLPADNPLTEEGIMLGRMLFYDPIVSGDSTLSCSQCHQQNKGFSDPRKVSVGITGQLGGRNSMPIQNLMWNHHFFWDGRANSIREQVLMPIQAHDEMNMNLFTLVQKLERTPRYQLQFKKAFNVTKITPLYISKGLEQFIVTLISFNAKIDKLWGRNDTLNIINASALRGLNLFMRPSQSGGADCFHCHSNIPFFGNNSIDASMSNNGLDAVITDQGFGNITGHMTDIGKFKIPSLRNIERTGPYMHDGRFQTLQEVLDFYSDKVQFNSPNLDINLDHNKVPLNLSSQQKTDIIEFLKTLTDTTFLNNPNFKTPF